jgi:biotin carboxylase
MGGRGCRLVANDAELSEAVAAAMPYSRSGQVIIEQYMDGPEFSVDAIVYHGKITICGLAERHIFYPPYFIEMGHTMPCDLPSDTQEALLETFREGVRALGIEIGAAKGDIKLTSSGPMIGEIAARLSGGYMSGWTYPYSSGVEATRAALLVAIGESPGNLEPLRLWTSAERAFISIPGKVRSIEGIEAVKNGEHVKDLFLRVKAGDEVSFPENNVGKCGNVISAAPTRDSAIFAAESACRAIIIRLEPNNAATDAFLAQSLDTAFPPSAFGREQREKRKEKRTELQSENFALCSLLSAHSSLKDYAGRTIEDTLEIVRRLTGQPLQPDTLSDGFWHALLRGGYQGAAYFIDSGGQ